MVNYGRLTSMSNMLPTRNSGLLSLAEVLPSCFSSMGLSGYENALDLPSVRSAIVVVIDGLGFHNLRNARGHARFLAQATLESDPLETVFPSTTAAALTSFTTGVLPGVHGMLGYQIRDPETGDLINQLSGLKAIENPQHWLKAEPLFVDVAKQGCTSFVVGHSRFADSTLTSVIYRGASYVGANSLDDRMAQSSALIRATSPQLGVVYISELDEISHKKGVDSPEWATVLEDVDAAIAALSAHLPDDIGLFVTADHGVIDIPQSKHFLLGNSSSFFERIASIGGEPRCPQLYFLDSVSPSDKKDFIAEWQKDFDGIASVLTQEQLVESGLFPELNTEVAGRAGDVFLLSNKNVVFYDARDTTLKGRSMVGQHGGVSVIEMHVPAIKLAGFSRN